MAQKPGARSKPYRIDDQIGAKLGKAYNQALNDLRARLTPFDITPQQMGVMMRLKEQGEASQNSLGRMVNMNPATIHGIAKKLVGRGLVELSKAPDDQRLTVLRLTPEGKALAKKMQPHSNAASEKTRSPLSKAEQQRLDELLDKLNAG